MRANMTTLALLFTDSVLTRFFWGGLEGYATFRRGKRP